MARPKSLNPKVEIHIRLAPDVLALLELESYDPYSATHEGRTPYGARNQIIEVALRQYFARKTRAKVPAPKSQVSKPGPSQHRASMLQETEQS